MQISRLKLMNVLHERGMKISDLKLPKGARARLTKSGKIQLSGAQEITIALARSIAKQLGCETKDLLIDNCESRETV